MDLAGGIAVDIGLEIGTVASCLENTCACTDMEVEAGVCIGMAAVEVLC